MPTRLNPFSYLPRRLQIIAVLTLFVLFCIIFVGSQNANTLDPYLGPKLQKGVHHVVEGAQHVADYLPNPLDAPAHGPPPDQANSSSGEARWYSDWKWRNPFSSSVTLDQERAVLPPLGNRPPIYTYYDLGQRRKDEQSRKAEQDLLHIWRRAWWAQGFRPVILSKSDARNNPLYQKIQHVEMERGLENELMRWLAWGNMGTGILSNFVALPMAAYDDPLLSFLRRGEYPVLSRYEGIGNGLFVGSKADIDAALKEAVSSPALKRVKFIDEAIPEGTISVEKKPASIAYYSSSVIKEKYPPIKEKLDNSTTVGDGLAMLPALINAHLHQIWQNQFPKGVAVLKPLPEHTTSMIDSAMNIAANLTECPITPIPSSCPPNKPKCKACVSNQISITSPKTFRNDSEVYTIATMPHPYTIQSLVKSQGEMDLRYIRRETDRDIWIRAVTNILLGNGPTSFARLPVVKDAIASEYGSSRSLWLTAELPGDKTFEELDWIFGFRVVLFFSPGKSETPVPGPERRPKPDYGDGPVLSEAELQAEKTLLDRAKAFVQKASPTRDQIEAWNLADTEIYKFIRAFNARRTMERHQWEDEESSFLGKGAFDRWIDKII